MKNDGQTIEEKIEEIRSIATRNDFSVKYNTVVDILNEEREDIIEDVIQKLQQEYDIRVEQSEDEDYETDFHQKNGRQRIRKPFYCIYGTRLPGRLQGKYRPVSD